MIYYLEETPFLAGISNLVNYISAKAWISTDAFEINDRYAVFMGTCTRVVVDLRLIMDKNPGNLCNSSIYKALNADLCFVEGL